MIGYGLCKGLLFWDSFAAGTESAGFVAPGSGFVAPAPLRRLDPPRRRNRCAEIRTSAYPELTAAGDRLAPLASSPAANRLKG
jgi:hypothetical protein